LYPEREVLGDDIARHPGHAVLRAWTEDVLSLLGATALKVCSRPIPVPSMKQILALALCLLLVLSTQAIGGGETDPPDWSDVRGIFVERCVMCHSAQGAALGLRLDTYEAAISGSTNGAVLLAGEAERSELIRRLRGESVPRMPFLGYPLPEDQIELITDWVDEGLVEKN